MTPPAITTMLALTLTSTTHPKRRRERPARRRPTSRVLLLARSYLLYSSQLSLSTCASLNMRYSLFSRSSSGCSWSLAWLSQQRTKQCVIKCFFAAYEGVRFASSTVNMSIEGVGCMMGRAAHSSTYFSASCILRFNLQHP
jgi:hypothetical protein